jgi:hypothetical protein
MQLRGSPAKRECKEKLHKKRKKETKIREFFKASLAAWLNLNISLRRRHDLYRVIDHPYGIV